MIPLYTREFISAPLSFATNSIEYYVEKIPLKFKIQDIVLKAFEGLCVFGTLHLTAITFTAAASLPVVPLTVALCILSSVNTMMLDYWLSIKTKEYHQKHKTQPYPNETPQDFQARLADEEEFSPYRDDYRGKF